jgi:hypothetical protein
MLYPGWKAFVRRADSQIEPLTFGLAATPQDDAVSPPAVPAGDSGKPLGHWRKRGAN